MSVIERDDGVKFILNTYRDVRFATKGSIFRQDVAELQKENGNFARFFELGGGEVEVVFSNNSGFLLAECVSSYFENPYNMIFCERLADQDNAVLIVVKDGAVFLDAMLPVSLLVDDFISLSTSEGVKYDIYAYGNIPLAEISSDEKFAFAPELVRSFKWLDSPLIPRVDPDPTYQLVAVENAFKYLSFAKPKAPIVIIGLIVLLGVGFLIYELLKPKEVVKPVRVQKPVVVDPYIAYKKTLATPSPTQLIQAYTKQVHNLMTIPGWDIQATGMQNQQITASLEQAGGSANILLFWLKQKGVSMQLDNGRATLTVLIHVPNRQPPDKIYNIKDMVAEMYDRLRMVVQSDSISIGSTSVRSNFVEMNMSVSISGLTPTVVDFIAQQFADLPVTLDNLSFNINEGLMTGTIDFTVVGAVEK